MRDQPRLGRFVVIGCDNQRGIGTHISRKPHQVQRFGSAIRARARHNRDSPCRVLHDDFDNLFVFIMRKRGGFAGRANGNQPVATLINMPINQRTTDRLGIL